MMQFSHRLLNSILNISLSAVFLFAASFFVSCSKKDKSDIVAKVDGAVLTHSQILQQMKAMKMRPDQEHDFVEHWVNNQLLYEEAKRQGLDKSKDLAEELEKVKKEFVIQKLLEKIFSEKIKVSDEEISSYYENNTDLFQVAEDEVRALHILTKTRAEANIAHQEILAGKPFKTVAKERSAGYFKERGGDMGFFTRKDVIPEVARYAFRLRPGTVSPVFKSPQGYHIIKIIKKRTKGSIKELNDVKDEIAQRLRVTKERSVYYDLLFQLQHSEKVDIITPVSKTGNADSAAAN
ncbi:peptidyl-prolyl cis-trans isomerase [bacterium]|nr:peptidyl-prolyl cis-trans isomerase [bacterium]